MKKKMEFSCRYQDSKLGFLLRNEVEIHLWSASDEEWKSRGAQMASEPIISGAESFLAGTVSCRIEVEVIDDLYHEYAETNVLYNHDTVVEEKAWGTREFATKDLHGNLITF